MTFSWDKARELGADYVFPADDFSVDKLRVINKERLAERVVVCAGVPQAVESAIASVDRKGKYFSLQFPMEDIPLPSLRFWRDEDHRGILLRCCIPAQISRRQWTSSAEGRSCKKR